MSRQLEPYQQIERSIQKTYHKRLWTPFITAVKQYDLIAPGDRIAACISGGKDSMLMAKLLQLLQRHSDVPFELVYLVMDPGYNAANRQKIEYNAALLHIPVTIFSTDIFEITSTAGQSPCYLCARMRRGYLYSKARELGCNKIGSSSKRQEVKLLLRELRRTNPGVEKSIFHSIHSVCLDTMVGYKTGGVEHTFADCYRERGEMTQEDET